MGSIANYLKKYYGEIIIIIHKIETKDAQNQIITEEGDTSVPLSPSFKKPPFK